jgi:hypothetical protein
VLSLVWGILAIIGMIIGLFPCLGALNWLNIPFSAVGLIVSIVVLNKANPGQKGCPIVGLVFCIIAVVFGIVRLVAGGGVI